MSENFESGDWYKSNYSVVNATAIKGSTANKVLHKMIEKPFKSNKNLNLLEVGANDGEHLDFVIPDFESYLMTDIRPFQGKIISDGQKGRVKFEKADVQALQYPDETFDRVISTCLFHHLNDPFSGFSEIRRVTKVGGTVSILIPNDPGIFYRILRSVTTNRNARKMGLKAEANLNHALEHRNHYLQLNALLHEVFKSDKVTQNNYPFRVKGYDINALTTFHIIRTS